MNKLLFAAGLLVLFIGQSLAEEETADMEEETLHSIVKRSYPYPGGLIKGGPGFSGVGPSRGNFNAGFAGNAAFGGSAGFPGGNVGRPRQSTRPNYFAVPTRYTGYTTDYYYPVFEYAFVPAGYAYNYYEVPIHGTFGSKGGYGGKAINVNVGGNRGYYGQGGKFW